MKSKILILITALLCIAFGSYNLFQPFLDSGGSKIIGDLGDSRLVTIFLEHNYKYFTVEGYDSYWSPTWAYFPVKGVFAFSETLASASPIYAIPRMLGVPPIESMQIWTILCTILNFIAMYILARILKIRPLGAILAGCIFSFALPRAGFSNHPHLFAHFFSVFAFCFLALLYKEPRVNSRSYIYAAACGISFSLQLWSSTYLFWFSFLLCLIGLVVVLSFKAPRQDFFAFVKMKWTTLAVAILSLLIASYPILSRYLKTKEMFGGRSFGEVAQYIATFQQIFQPYFGSSWFGWLGDIVSPANNPGFWEKYIFVGFLVFALTLGFIVFSFSKSKDKWHRVLAVVVILFSILPLKFFGIKLWSILFGLPGADAIRVPTRLVLTNLSLYGLASALWLQKAVPNERKYTLVATMLLAIFFVESSISRTWNFNIKEHHDRIQKIVEHPEFNSCEVLERMGDVNSTDSLDLMWTALMYDKKTVNGYTGQTPTEISNYLVKGQDNEISWELARYSVCHYDP